MKYKQLVIGVLLGSMITGAGAAAASQSTTITAFLKDGILFKFNGEEKKLEDGYSVLNYKNSTYVPARFVAEELGATVTWDNKTQTISINSSVGSKEPVQSNSTNPVVTKPEPTATVTGQAATKPEPSAAGSDQTATNPNSTTTETKPAEQASARDLFDKTWSSPDGSVTLDFSSDTQAEAEVVSKVMPQLNGVKFTVKFQAGVGSSEFSVNGVPYHVSMSVVYGSYMDFTVIDQTQKQSHTIIYLGS
jgi:Copper amine oxidase N-terminal domain.